MAVKKSKRLQPVLKLAERNRQMAEQALGQAQRQLSEELQKLEQLQNYQRDYEQQAREQQARGAQPGQLVRLQEFMSKMQGALQQQMEQVVISQQMMNQAKGLWQVAQGRYQAMDSLIDRHKVTEAQLEDKKLQQAIDELMQNRRSS